MSLELGFTPRRHSAAPPRQVHRPGVSRGSKGALRPLFPLPLALLRPRELAGAVRRRTLAPRPKTRAKPFQNRVCAIRRRSASAKLVAGDSAPPPHRPTHPEPSDLDLTVHIRSKTQVKLSVPVNRGSFAEKAPFSRKSTRSPLLFRSNYKTALCFMF